METLEMMVYIAIAIIVGGTLVFVIKTVDFKGTWESYVSHYRQREAPTYKIGKDRLADEIARRWSECRMGLDERNYSVYLEDSAMITRGFVIDELQRKDHCDAIDCKNRSGRLIIAESIETPKIIYIKCYNESLIVG
jgi:hypothetical protein